MDGKYKGNRYRHTVEWCVECLSEGRKTTDEIRTYVNKRSCHGISGRCLGMLLHRVKQFRKVDEVWIPGALHTKRVCVWELALPSMKNESNNKDWYSNTDIKSGGAVSEKIRDMAKTDDEGV